ncbi:MAG: glycosyltransferase [Actinobacteria bacterium]|nr:glycosyltransferase [Actinomycetota bacterium]MSX86774.1 glycosyltransferase [Actinomycetota bacterium]
MVGPRLDGWLSPDAAKLPSARVAVVIPVFDGEHSLERCLQSLVDQTYQDFVVVVVDDGSTDESAAVARSHIDRLSCLSVLQQANAGPGAARNTGINASRSEFVAMLDADDEWAPTRLERCIEMLERDVGLTFVTTTAVIVDEAGLDLGFRAGEKFPSASTERLLSVMAHHNVVFTSCVVRRSALETVGAFAPERLLLGAEDYELWLRLLLIPGARAANIAEPLARYTMGSAGISLSDPARNERARLEALRRHADALAKRGAYCRPGDAVEIALTALSRRRVREALQFFGFARLVLRREGRPFVRLVIGRARRRVRSR